MFLALCRYRSGLSRALLVTKILNNEKRIYHEIVGVAYSNLYTLEFGTRRTFWTALCFHSKGVVQSEENLLVLDSLT